jgi:BMFP domain-containing protein YqiC
MTSVIASAERIWNELDYAQRRAFELTSGVPLVKPEQRKRLRGSVEELEALYALDASDRC